MESYSRIRSVKLKRPTHEHPFGFSVRGGHEHGTGIFVSFVDQRSSAHRQGLKIGDQILRVNGYPVSAAVHHECLSLMKTRTSLHLKVRGVGMLPVKEKLGDPLTWKLVEEPPLPQPHNESPGSGSGHHDHRNNHHHHLPLISRMSDTSSQQSDSRNDHTGSGGEAKIYIDTSGQSGLGCCICKGPPERPGIFVQSTKSNGVAREAGLRPGDQILHCNGHSFINIPFAEAVYYLKSSKNLSLQVLKGAASDLFPGESSGYNSSASSLNGDPHAFPHGSGGSESSSNSAAEIHIEHHEGPPKRLSMVSEETSDDRGSGGKKNVVLDKNIEWDEVEQVWKRAAKESIIIEVNKSHGGKSKYKSEEERLYEERKKLQEEQQKLIEEAIRLEEEKRKFEEEKRKTLKKSPSINSTSSESTNSLAGALHLELLKRSERRESVQQNKSEDEQTNSSGSTGEQKKNFISSGIDEEKRQQHEQLIEEFKKAHRKMFAQPVDDDSDGEFCRNGTEKERESFRAKRIQKEVEHEKAMIQQRVAGIVKQRQLRIERQHQEIKETEREVSKFVKRNPGIPPPPPPGKKAQKSTRETSWKDQPKLPPGPLYEDDELELEKQMIELPKPMPSLVGNKSKFIPIPTIPPQLQPQSTSQSQLQKQNGANSQISKSIPIPMSKQNGKQVNGFKTKAVIIDDCIHERPESPSPDYSNSPSPTPSENASPKVSKKNEKVVRLSTYPSVYARPEPSRLDFLDTNGNNHVGSSSGSKEVILQRQLEDALSRCNLQTGRSANTNNTTSTITSNSNGKVTIILGNENGSGGSNHNHNHHQHPSANHHKPNGGILKMSNGHHSSSSSQSTTKTISFGNF